MDYDKLLNEIKRIHFIGIGGSGMCPIAEIMMSEGFEISGSDMNEGETFDKMKGYGIPVGETLDKMKGYGIPVYMGHAAENIKGAELVVYSAAVKETNPERKAAVEQGIPCIERSVMLGVVCRRYKRSIAVSGTHGKTSTTAMLSQILIGSGFDPSAIIGGKLPFIGGNSYVGQSDIIVCEACEYVDTFLQLNPFISIILNIDADHLDYFKNLDNIKKSFNQFSKQTTGLLVINGDDQNTLDAVNDVDIEKITFKLIVPGRHNIYNSLAAAATAHYLGATPNEISENLHKFGGVHRRFEILGTPCGITVADDFAHHPTELTATLNAAMQMGFNKVWAVFQPHTFSRTAMLLDDFAEALKIPDVAIVSEILPVRETNTYNIYATDLTAKIPGSVYRKTFEEITDYVCQNAKEGDLILTMGGGNVYMCANMINKQLKFMEENN